MSHDILISALNGWLRMNDHGHVRPDKDKPLARCGGPAICKTCIAEARAINLRAALENALREQK